MALLAKIAAATAAASVAFTGVAVATQASPVIVDRVVDGDTIDVWVLGRTVRVRLLNIDAPETKDPSQPTECLGPEAARFLEGRGYRVLHVTRPAQALQLWTTACNEVSLVICDLVLPGMNGRQLVERLRETRPALPVLFVSGYPDEATEPTAGLGPSAAFLSKPFDLSELEVRIADLLAAAE